MILWKSWNKGLGNLEINFPGCYLIMKSSKNLHFRVSSINKNLSIVSVTSFSLKTKTQLTTSTKILKIPQESCLEFPDRDIFSVLMLQAIQFLIP